MRSASRQPRRKRTFFAFLGKERIGYTDSPSPLPSTVARQPLTLLDLFSDELQLSHTVDAKQVTPTP